MSVKLLRKEGAHQRGIHVVSYIGIPDVPEKDERELSALHFLVLGHQFHQPIGVRYSALHVGGLHRKACAGKMARHGCDGVICGHIHYAIIRDEQGIRYMNCGDWVESCTALVEHEDGRFEIITWPDLVPRTEATPRRVAARAA